MRIQTEPTLTFSAVGGTGLALLTNTVVTIKPTPGLLVSFDFYNPNGAVTYIQLFDTLNAILGTTPPKLAYSVPGNGWLDAIYVGGITFNTAITIAATTTATNATAPATGVSANIVYR